MDRVRYLGKPDAAAHGQGDFTYHFRGPLAENGGAQNPPAVRPRKYLDESVARPVNDGAVQLIVGECIGTYIDK